MGSLYYDCFIYFSALNKVQLTKVTQLNHLFSVADIPIVKGVKQLKLNYFPSPLNTVNSLIRDTHLRRTPGVNPRRFQAWKLHDPPLLLKHGFLFSS